MLPAAIIERLDALIDDLILDGGVASASLASILLTAKDAVKRDDHLKLSRHVWAMNNDLLVQSPHGEAITSHESAAPRRKRLPKS